MSKNVIEITRVAMIWRMEIKVLTLELNSLFCYNISNRLLFFTQLRRNYSFDNYYLTLTSTSVQRIFIFIVN